MPQLRPGASKINKYFTNKLNSYAFGQAFSMDWNAPSPLYTVKSIYLLQIQFKHHGICEIPLSYLSEVNSFPGAPGAQTWACLHTALNTSSVQFSRSVVSDSLWPHESQHTRPPCPSPPPGVCSDSCPWHQWCHPTISSSDIPFSSSCLQSFPASESFPMSQLFAWSGQSTGVSALASFLPKKSQGWSSEWTGWISLQSKGLSRVFLKPQFKSISSLVFNCLYNPTLTSIHDCWKNHSFD